MFPSDPRDKAFGRKSRRTCSRPPAGQRPGVQAKPVGTVEARMPRLSHPAELEDVAEKLRTHNVKVEVLAKPIKVSGRGIRRRPVIQGRGGNAPPLRLEGGFAPSPVKEFPAGTFRVDLAQPCANVAF